ASGVTVAVGVRVHLQEEVEDGASNSNDVLEMVLGAGLPHCLRVVRRSDRLCDKQRQLAHPGSDVTGVRADPRVTGDADLIGLEAVIRLSPVVPGEVREVRRCQTLECL